MLIKESFQEAYDKALLEKVDEKSEYAFSFAIKWAETMEFRMADGAKQVADCADEALRDCLIHALSSHELEALDAKPIIDYSLFFLGKIWKYDKEFQRWLLIKLIDRRLEFAKCDQVQNV